VRWRDSYANPEPNRDGDCYRYRDGNRNRYCDTYGYR
jgi:hypothetical protein